MAWEGTGLSPHAGSWLWAKQVGWSSSHNGMWSSRVPPEPGHPDAGVGATVPLLRRVLVAACPLCLGDPHYLAVALSPATPVGTPGGPGTPVSPQLLPLGSCLGSNGVFCKARESFRRFLKQILSSSRDKTTREQVKGGPSPAPTDLRCTDHIPMVVIPPTASKSHPAPLQTEPLAPVKTRARDALVAKNGFLSAAKVDACSACKPGFEGSW